MTLKPGSSSAVKSNFSVNLSAPTNSSLIGAAIADTGASSADESTSITTGALLCSHFNKVPGPIKIAIVHAQWHLQIIEKLIQAFIDTCNSECEISARNEASIAARPGITIDTFSVGGSYELPLACKQVSLSKYPSYDCVVAIGVLIQGETAHFQHIATSLTHHLHDCQLETDIPIVFGVLTCYSLEQAWKRSGVLGNTNLAHEWAHTALKLSIRRREYSSFKSVIPERRVVIGNPIAETEVDEKMDVPSSEDDLHTRGPKRRK